ncbi:DUF4351 domain-containing protein [Nocardia sp. NEAU-G5]|uniref:DUF4351 domain-containing protein n=1 Tax=Nocardia albiluteola TaxID=2842303 RepID=A0ABS6B1K3_9NOCA|nr:DUF4351 domain-containing protein [Nocardia albiluteola]MBU3064190.1 DUF4351 domain-containing protein [Nocardia albiluteola]
MTTAEMLEARGEARGGARDRATMLLRQLAKRFGPLPAAVQETVRAADVDRLELRADRVLSPAALDEVLA